MGIVRTKRVYLRIPSIAISCSKVQNSMHFLDTRGITVDILTLIWWLIHSIIHFHYLFKSGCESALTVISTLKIVLDSTLMAAAYCGVSIVYWAQDAIFGLVLWQMSSSLSRVSMFVIVRVLHGYTAGQDFPHRTCTRKHRTHSGYIPIPTHTSHGTLRNLWYHNYLQYIIYKNSIKFYHY